STKVAVSATVEARGLIQHFQQWSALHQKQLQLWRAKQDAISSAINLAAKHESFEQQLGTQKEEPAGHVANGNATPSAASTNSEGLSREESMAALKTTKRSTADRKMLATLDKRIDNEKQLANVYAQWIDVVAA